MTVAEKITDYLTKHSGKWIRPSCIAECIGAPKSTVSASLAKLLSDGAVQRRTAKFASKGSGSEYSISEGAAQ